MSMRPTDIRLPGAVDLSALRAAPQPAPGASGGAGAYVVDVTEASFQADVLERSRDVPVVVDFWAAWCGPCKQLSPVLERLAAEAKGAWILAKIDVDANQRIAAAARVQSIPTVMAFVDGQPVHAFLGALPEAQVRSWLAEVLQYASGDAAAPMPPEDPAYAEADAAIGRGDLDGAIAAYRQVLERNPGDPDAKLALARAQLLKRAREHNGAAVRRRAADDPSDIDAALAVADLDVAAGAVEDAIRRLVELVRVTTGAERDRVRAHLVGLFEVLDPDDPRLAAGRRALSNALF